MSVAIEVQMTDALICSRGPVDLKAKYTPSLLNTAVYLLGLSQQVSTFVINFQGRPFREGITENPPLYYGLLGVSAIAFAGATEFIPELNDWLQLFKMTSSVSRSCFLAEVTLLTACSLIHSSD